MTPPDLAALVRGLSESQRNRLKSFAAEPRQMGIGMMQFLPNMVEPDGLNHPIFGPHYRLTPLGLRAREALLSHKARGE